MAEDSVMDKALSRLSLTFDEFLDLTPDQLHRHWRDLMKAAHPDLPQNRARPGLAAEINASYDLLRGQYKESRVFSATPRAPASQSDAAPVFRKSEVPDTDVPAWQPDRHAMNNKIFHQSFRDINYLKKHFWDLSGQSKEVYTLDAFGHATFEGRTKLYAKPELFDEMAQAMLVWNANGGKLSLTRAVFVSSAEAPNKLLLVYADGRAFGLHPIPLPYDPAAGSPYNDQLFKSRLPMVLDKIREMHIR